MNKKKNIFAGSDCLSQKVLQDYLNDKLSNEEKRIVEEHLIDCILCTDELEGLASMKDRRKLEGIVDSIQQELGVSDGRRLRIRPAFQLAAAIAVIFIVTGTIFLVDYLSDNGTREMISQSMEDKTSPENTVTEKHEPKETYKTQPATNVEDDINAEEIVEEEELIHELDLENDIVAFEAEGAGVGEEIEGAVLGDKNEKKAIVIQEIAGQKSRKVFSKSNSSKGQDHTLSGTSKIDSAAIYNNLKQYDKAIEYLQGLLKYDKRNEKVLYELALNYYEINDYKRSLKYTSRLLEMRSGGYDKECETLLNSIIFKSSKYRSRAEKLLDSIK